MTEAIIIAKCVGCGKEREIRKNEIKPGDVPMCDSCYMPMVAVRVIGREVEE